jgi:predicted fused transcriptional regulator/phosphomethylpyrimidine kinase/predicted transcriptional regulator
LSPLDLIARYVSPWLRALVAIELAGRGLGQTRIARLLGITQPMVTKYLRSGRNHAVEALRRVGVDPEEAEAVAKVLAEALYRGRVQDYMRIVTSYEAQLLARGSLCSLHRRIAPDLPADCRICEYLLRYSTDPIVEEVVMAYRLLVEEPNAHLLVPEVGANIVAAKPGARSIMDVVGFTGRIIRVGSRLQAVGYPAYGGSRHTANVLLAMHSRWRSVRGCIVVRLLNCTEALDRHNMVYAKVGPHQGPKHLLDDLKQAIRRLREPVDVLLDLGGPGLEPVAYYFGSTAIEAVEKALKYLRTCTQSTPRSSQA